MSHNPNPAIVPLLENNLEKVDWEGLSWNKNPAIVPLLEQNLDKVNWTGLSGNPNPAIVPLLEQNLEKVDWLWLSHNPNPAILPLLCKLDLQAMRENNYAFAEELCQYVFHPDRLVRMAHAFEMSLEEWMEHL